MPSFTAHLSRHSHDVNCGFTSTLAPSLIVPQYFDILQPGDSVYYKTHAFARLQDIVTAFFGEVQVHIDYFFVPLTMLYTPFGSQLMQTNDELSSAISYGDIPDEEKFPLLNVFSSIAELGISEQSEPNTECIGKSLVRLLDALDANPYIVFNPAFNHDLPASTPLPVGYASHPKISPWLFAAYQAIYQDYFRNDNLERRDVGSFNFDHCYDTTEFHDIRFLMLHRSYRVSDYFTDIKVSPIASSVNRMSYQDESFAGDVLTNIENYLGFADEKPNIIGEFRSNYGSNWLSTDSAPVSDTLNAANIRSLFAVEKYCRIWGRADKTYDDQILAHFGYKVPHDVKHQLTHLKHYKMVLQSDPVFATTAYSSDDGQQSLGQVGGQCSGALNSDGEKFTAPVHGVFMCVAHVSSIPRYFGTFSKLHNLSSIHDFPMPEYDKLGMQPFYAYECMRGQFNDSDDALSVRLGWQYRYQQFKKKYNRVSVAFSGGYLSNELTSNVYSPWVLSQIPFPLRENENYPSDPWFSRSQFLPYTSFKQSPYDLNNIMVVPYDGRWSNDYYASPWLMFQTDPVIFEFKCDCKKVSWMSETGEPDL